MQEILAGYGLYGMFLMGFLAATILPLGSEWLLIFLLMKGADPFGVVASAALGNYLGGCTNYLLGIFGSGLINLKETKRKRAENIYNRYGVFSLLFSWVPVIGDPLCIISGVLRYSFLRFSVLVFTGKALRYAFLAYITVKTLK